MHARMRSSLAPPLPSSGTWGNLYVNGAWKKGCHIQTINHFATVLNAAD